jgi:hypothetical protein
MFGGLGINAHHVLSYYKHDDKKFRIGHVGGSLISADLGRAEVETKFRDDYPNIVHLALAPHEGNGSVGHNHVEYLGKPKGFNTVVADAVIAEKGDYSLAVEVFVADCAVVCFASSTHFGFAHCGRPEAMANPSIIENFLTAWPCAPEETFAYIGPTICGEHYGLDFVPEEYMRFTTKCAFPDKTGFSLSGFILLKILDFNTKLYNNTEVNGICPYCRLKDGDERWTSDQWAKMHPDEGPAARDCAMFTYNPK